MGRLQAHAEGVIEATNINGATVVSSMHYNYPLKFISVNNHTKTHSTAWLYEINYGGGLVSGDEVTINMTLNDSCSAVLSGQSSMKIYKSKQDGANSGASAHHLAANVGKDSLLCIAYPAVTCFAGAEYDQTQIVKLEDETSNVIIVEWTTSGRVALGESWDFAMLQTKNEIWLSGELLIKEAVRLSDADSPLTVKERMHPFTSMATIVLVGPRVLPYARCIHEEIGKMQIGGMGAKQQNTLVCSSSALKYRKKPGDEEATVGFMIKVAAHTNSQVNEFIHEMLENTWTDLLGDDPYK